MGHEAWISRKYVTLNSFQGLANNQHKANYRTQLLSGKMLKQVQHDDLKYMPN